MPQPGTSAPSRFAAAAYQWILTHDDKKLFVTLYIGLAVVLSVFVSLFWLVAVVVAHGIMEWIAQRPRQQVAAPALLVVVLWELKLDIALILLAFVVTVYMEFVMGVAGLNAATRLGRAGELGLRSSTKFAGWQQAIRGVLLSVDDAAQVVRGVFRARMRTPRERATTPKQLPREPQEKMAAVPSSPFAPVSWRTGDWISLALAAVAVIVLVTAPLITRLDAASVIRLLTAELHPWP